MQEDLSLLSYPCAYSAGVHTADDAAEEEKAEEAAEAFIPSPTHKADSPSEEAFERVTTSEFADARESREFESEEPKFE